MHDGKSGTRSSQKGKQEKGFDSDHPGSVVSFFIYLISVVSTMAVLLLLLVVSKNLDLRTAKPESAGSWERMARKQIPEVQSLY